MLITAIRDFRHRVARLKTRKRKQPQDRQSAEVLEVRQLLTAISVSPQEQLLVELINRARSDPNAEAARYGISLNSDLAAGTISSDPKQPLALNQILTNVTEAHSQDIIDRDFFAHENPDGDGPTDRALAAGYPLGVWENIGIRGTTGTINPTSSTLSMHEGLIKSAGHRKNIMRDAHVELGVGLETGQWTDVNNIFGNGAGATYNALVGTENFANPDLMFITGVAFHDDVTADGFYTVGEGHSSGTIAIVSDSGEIVDSINTAGGYQFAVPAGNYVVQFDDGINTYTVADVEVINRNVKVDFETLSASAQVDIDVSFAATSISENGGSTTGTVTRGNGTQGNISAAYVIDLLAVSGDISIPSSVTIPAGSYSADFAITANDNSTLDGTRETEIIIDAANSVPNAGVLLVTDYEQNLVINGTDGDDLFEYQHEHAPGVHQVTINATAYEFEGQNLTIQFNGLAGSDTLDLQGSSGDDIVNFAPNQVTVTTAATDLNLSGTTMEIIRADGNGGTNDRVTFADRAAASDSLILKPIHSWMSGSGYYNFAVDFDSYIGNSSHDPGDTAQIYDSGGDDTLFVFDTDSILTGSGFSLRADSFPLIDVWSTSGGTDDAQFTDSSGNDVYNGRPTKGSLSTPTATVIAHQFDTYEVLGIGGGTDVAYLYDSVGNDSFLANGTVATLSGSGFEHKIDSFDTVVARSTAGGNDTATFNDTSADDLYVAKYNASYMSGAGFYNYAADFETTAAHSTAGDDTAQLYDSPGKDLLVAKADYSYMTGPGYYSYTQNFATTLAFSTLGGDDTAQFYDTVNDDILVTRPDYTYLLSSSVYNYAVAFSATYSFSTLGGNDTVQFYDSSGDDLFITKPAYAYMLGTGFYNYANGFVSTAAYATLGGFDQAQLYDSTGSDSVQANHVYAKITIGTTGFSHWAVYFDKVDAWSTKGGTDTAEQLGALDFAFSEFGNWNT